MILDVSYKNALAASIVLLLCACGGGDSGATDNRPTNSAPIADAGMDRAVDEQTRVTLDGSSSGDPDGDRLIYAWSQTAGVPVALAGADAAQVSFDGPDVGIGSSTTLTFALRVSDPAGASSTATVDVVVNGVSNSDPTVNAGDNQSVSELDTVNLNGSATDTDIGDSLSFNWTQTSGTAVSITGSDTANASFDAPAVGAGGETLVFQLAVNDGTVTITDSVAITVSEASATVTVAGRVFYEFVPASVVGSQCTGLNFSATQTRPIRQAKVQLIGSDNAVLGNTNASDSPGKGAAYRFGQCGPRHHFRRR